VLARSIAITVVGWEGGAAGGRLLKSAPGRGVEVLARAVAVELELDDEKTGCLDRLLAREGRGASESCCRRRGVCW
jgi:hypothetical protein